MTHSLSAVCDFTLMPPAHDMRYPMSVQLYLWCFHSKGIISLAIACRAGWTSRWCQSQRHFRVNARFKRQNKLRDQNWRILSINFDHVTCFDVENECQASAWKCKLRLGFHLTESGKAKANQNSQKAERQKDRRQKDKRNVPPTTTAIGLRFSTFRFSVKVWTRPKSAFSCRYLTLFGVKISHVIKIDEYASILIT